MYSCKNTTMMETHTEIGKLPLLFSSVHKRLMVLTYSYCAHDTYYHVSNDIKHKCMYVCMYIYIPRVGVDASSWPRQGAKKVMFWWIPAPSMLQRPPLDQAYLGWTSDSHSGRWCFWVRTPIVPYYNVATMNTERHRSVGCGLANAASLFMMRGGGGGGQSRNGPSRVDVLEDSPVSVGDKLQG